MLVSKVAFGQKYIFAVFTKRPKKELAKTFQVLCHFAAPNPLLCNRQIVLMAKKPWEMLRHFRFDEFGGGIGIAENQVFENWLSLLDKLRTFFKENPDAEF